MLRKHYTAEFKALTAEDGATRPGEFEALVAVYDNVDRQGDRIKSGAFDETLEAWRKSGDPIPIILEHQWGDPWAHIGYADAADVKSIPGRGLMAKGVLDIETNPLAQQVHRLMTRRTLKEFSFGYRVPEGGEKKASDGAYDLNKLDLIEFGPCLQGVNDSTELLAVKAEVEAQATRERGEEPTLEERLTRLEAAVATLVESKDETEEPEGEPDSDAEAAAADKERSDAVALSAGALALDDPDDVGVVMAPPAVAEAAAPVVDEKSAAGDALRKQALDIMFGGFVADPGDAARKERLEEFENF